MCRAFIFVFLLSCSSPQTLTGVRINSNVPQAVLYIDDELRGPMEYYENIAIPLPPGQHRLRLEHPEYFREHIDVTVVQSIATSITVRMRPRPQENEREP